MGRYAPGRTFRELVNNGLLESRDLSSPCESDLVEVCQVELFGICIIILSISELQQVRENRNSSREGKSQVICILSQGKVIIWRVVRKNGNFNSINSLVY